MSPRNRETSLVSAFKVATRPTQLLISIQKYKTVHALGQQTWTALVDSLPVTETCSEAADDAGIARKWWTMALVATQHPRTTASAPCLRQDNGQTLPSALRASCRRDMQ